MIFLVLAATDCRPKQLPLQVVMPQKVAKRDLRFGASEVNFLFGRDYALTMSRVRVLAS